MVMLSFLHKLSARYSLSRRILSKGLIRYLHPSDDALREIAGIPKGTHHHKNSRNRRDYNTKEDSKFSVPRNIALSLEAEPLNAIDIIPLPYYPEYQWLFDFAFCSAIIYLLTEVYYCIIPNNTEFNLSLIWCGLVIAFSMKILLSITALYFRGDEAMGERSLCIVSGCVFFLIAMIVLIIDENLLEFGLMPAYVSFNETAYQMLEANGMVETAAGPASVLMFKFWLSVWCGIIGVFFTFPGLRFAKMHRDALIYAQGNHVLRLILNFSFISPLFIVMLWVKPIARDYLTVRVWSYRGTIMSSDSFETTRMVLIVLVIALRFSLVKHYLQSYLNIAPQKLTLLKKESGKITNVDLQKLIARVFYYLCIVALQYIAPLFICLFMTFLMKTLGNYQWTSYFGLSPSIDHSQYNDIVTGDGPEFSIALLRKVFNPIVFRGLTGFMVWWLFTVWFSTSAIGFVYHTYFS